MMNKFTIRGCLICGSQVKKCTCLQFAQLCKTCRIKDTLDQEGNCTCCPLCGESKTKGRCSDGMTCQVSTETEMPENPSTMSGPNMQEPPDIGVPRNRSRLNHYLTILKRWLDEVIRKIIDWCNNRVGTNKHVDTVEVFNRFFNTTRMENESLINYIARFEDSYADVQKTGENLSSTC